MKQELTIADVARQKQVSHWTVRKWIYEGRLKCQRYGHNTVRITEDQLEEFTRQHRGKS